MSVAIEPAVLADHHQVYQRVVVCDQILHRQPGRSIAQLKRQRDRLPGLCCGSSVCTLRLACGHCGRSHCATGGLRALDHRAELLRAEDPAAIRQANIAWPIMLEPARRRLAAALPDRGHADAGDHRQHQPAQRCEQPIEPAASAGASIVNGMRATPPPLGPSRQRLGSSRPSGRPRAWV